MAHGDILASKYFNCGDLAIAIVAIEGGVGDWACYISGSVDTQSEEAAIEKARDGCKLYKDEAVALFPYLDASKYRH